MDLFEYRDGQLFCEGVPAAVIAAEVGTPVYVYSAATVVHHYHQFVEAFSPLNSLICFSVKCLANIHVLKILADAGSGFDVVSGGELARVKEIGADCSKVVFAGVAKTDAELTAAIEAGVGMFNVESEQEFENLSRMASRLDQRVRAALRVNPDVYDPKTHKYTTTGKKETKFGVDIDRAVRFFQTYGADPRVALDAIHIHIGSPIYSADPYVAAIHKTLELIEALRQKGHAVRTVDIGGGYAADYEEGVSPPATGYASEIVPLLEGSGLEVILEPGRQIACNAGVLLTEIQYVKKGGDREFLIVDAAMTDLIRPALYGSEHFIYPVKLHEGAPAPPRRIDHVPDGGVKVDVVGGVCETSDFLGRDRALPRCQRGELLSVFSVGAYGFVLSSTYNARPRAPEVLVEGNTYRMIRRRETYEDLIGPERI